jgi:hypothetical protein
MRDGEMRVEFECGAEDISTNPAFRLIIRFASSELSPVGGVAEEVAVGLIGVGDAYLGLFEISEADAI